MTKKPEAPVLDRRLASQFEDEILDLIRDDQNHMTTSDLQAAVSAIVLKIATAAVKGGTR